MTSWHRCIARSKAVISVPEALASVTSANAVTASPTRVASSSAACAIVLGHNVFRVIPNEVPILVVLGLLSMRLRTGGWAWHSLGFRRPTSWARIVQIAVGAATLRVVLAHSVIDPFTGHFRPPAKAPAGMDEIAGNIHVAGNQAPALPAVLGGSPGVF
jgi:hypothetical protein